MVQIGIDINIYRAEDAGIVRANRDNAKAAFAVKVLCVQISSYWSEDRGRASSLQFPVFTFEIDIVVLAVRAIKAGEERLKPCCCCCVHGHPSGGLLRV